MKLREISKKEYEDFCDDVQEKNIFQSKEWAEVKRRFGYHTYFVGLDQSGKSELRQCYYQLKLKC